MKKIFSNLVIGGIISIFFITVFFWATGINYGNFLEQYILFSKTIGEYRFSSYDFDFFNILNKFKFINFFIIILLFVFFDLVYKRKNIKESFIVLTSVFLALVLIFHQYYTLNQNFIFFLIPYLCCIVHIYLGEFKFKNYALIGLIVVCILSTFKYHLRFNEQRKFNELEKVDISKAIDAIELSSDLKGLKWITYMYPNDPKKEIYLIKEAMNILKSDTSNKVIITEYQFIAPSLKIYDFSPNQWHHPTVSFPIYGQTYYDVYKSFFLQSLNKNEIDFIFETTTKEKTITELILDKSCLKKERVSSMLLKFKLLKDCRDFK